MENNENPQKCPLCQSILNEADGSCPQCEGKKTQKKSACADNYPAVKSYFDDFKVRTTTRKIPASGVTVKACLIGLAMNIVFIILKVLLFGLMYLLMAMFIGLAEKFAPVLNALCGLITPIIALIVYYALTIAQFISMVEFSVKPAREKAIRLKTINVKQIQNIGLMSALLNFFVYAVVAFIVVVGYSYYDFVFNSANFNDKLTTLCFGCSIVFVLVDVICAMLGIKVGSDQVRDHKINLCQSCNKEYDSRVLKLPYTILNNLYDALKNKEYKNIKSCLKKASSTEEGFSSCELILFYCKTCTEEGVVELRTIYSDGKPENEKKTLIFSEKFSGQDFKYVNEQVTKHSLG